MQKKQLRAKKGTFKRLLGLVFRLNKVSIILVVLFMLIATFANVGGMSMVQNVLCVNESAHYHSGTEISQEWLNVAYHSCPFEIVGHGAVPHRVLRKHH